MNLKGIRKEVLSAEAYVSGKSMDDVKKEFGLDEVIKLGSNENPYPPFANTIEAMQAEIPKMNIYPEASFIKLRELLGEMYHLTSNHIGLAHGAGGVIETIAKLFIETGDEVIIPVQSYRLYKEVSIVMGADIKSIELDDNYTISVDQIVDQISNKTKLIWLCNPNNPTGTIIQKEDINKILDKLPENGWLVLDEAYAEFAEEKDLPSIDFIKENKHIIKVRTFSKYYGIAGARMGYAIAPPEVIQGYDTVSEPFNSSRIGLAAAITSITVDKENCKKASELIKSERTRVSKALEALGLEVVSSKANFIFFRVPISADDISMMLLTKGTIVRSCTGWTYPNHIRLSIGTKEEMDKFLEDIAEVLEA